jgi:3-hydroxypropanoate dehydrogenase
MKEVIMSALTQSPKLLAIDDVARSSLFLDARTANTFSDQAVSDQELSDIWELARWAPTSANVQPLRLVYVRTDEGKQRLAPFMSDNNRDKTATAPAVAILAADLDFHEHIPQLFPQRPQLKDAFAVEAMRHQSARFNAILQAGYFILAVRAVGLAAGPMLGFDGAGVDKEFFGDTTFTSILVVNIGHPGEDPWFERLPRLDHDQVITWA